MTLFNVATVTITQLPAMVDYGKAVQQENNSVLATTITTAGDIISGKLVADFVVDSEMCKELIIRPTSLRAGKFAETKVLSYQEEDELQNLLERAVDPILTEERVHEICTIAEEQLAVVAKKSYDYCKAEMQNEDSILGNARKKCSEVYVQAQEKIKSVTTYNTRRGILYGTLIVGGIGASVLSAPAYIPIYGGLIFARFWNSFTKEKDPLLNDKFFRIVEGGIGKAKIKQLRENETISEQEEQKASICLDEYVKDGTFNLSLMHEVAKKRVVSELHSMIKLKVIEAIKPVARAAIVEAAAVAKQIAEKGAEIGTTSTLKGIVRPLASCALLGAAGILTPFSLGIAALAPLAISAGTAVYEAACKYLERYEETERREKLIMIFEDRIGNFVIDGLEKLFNRYSISEEMQESAFETAKMLANPIAVNLVEYILQNKDDEFCRCFIEALEKESLEQNEDQVIEICEFESEEEFLLELEKMIKSKSIEEPEQENHFSLEEWFESQFRLQEEADEIPERTIQVEILTNIEILPENECIINIAEEMLKIRVRQDFEEEECLSFDEESDSLSTLEESSNVIPELIIKNEILTNIEVLPKNDPIVSIVEERLEIQAIEQSEEESDSLSMLEESSKAISEVIPKTEITADIKVLPKNNPNSAKPTISTARRIGRAVASVFLSIGLSQLFGVVKGVYDLVHRKIVRDDISEIEAQISQQGVQQDLIQERERLRTQERDLNVALKADLAALIPFVGAYYYWDILESESAS